MIAVAFAALSPAMLIERLFVFAAVEQTRVGRMPKAATVTHARDDRWGGGMITVTGIAARRPEIATRERLSVNARAIFGELRRR